MLLHALSAMMDITLMLTNAHNVLHYANYVQANLNVNHAEMVIEKEIIVLVK